MVGGERVMIRRFIKRSARLWQNCLINADYHGVRGVVIRKETDKIILQIQAMSEPVKKQMRLGGESDPRK